MKSIQQVEWAIQLQHHIVLLSQASKVIQKVVKYAAEADLPKLNTISDEIGLLKQMLEVMQKEDPRYDNQGVFTTNSLSEKDNELNATEYKEIVDYAEKLFMAAKQLYIQVEENLAPIVQERPD